MEICYRPIVPGDTDQLIELLMRGRPSITRLSNKFVYTAIIQEALKSKKIFCLVAVKNDNLIGYVFAATDWHRFQRLFILNHPLVALMIIVKEIQRLITRNVAEILRGTKPVISSSYTSLTENYQSKDNQKTIARIIHVGVEETERSKGIASSLYAALRKYLEKEGVTRIEANISEGNFASVRLHERAGWTMVKNPTGYFAFINTSEEKDGNTSLVKSCL